jgi:hypothetical protein
MPLRRRKSTWSNLEFSAKKGGLEAWHLGGRGAGRACRVAGHGIAGSDMNPSGSLFGD